MTPRPRVAAVQRQEPRRGRARARPRRPGYSRFPVYDENLDDIVGIVHVKQAVAVPRERRARGPGVGPAVRGAARARDDEARHAARRAPRPRLPDGGRRRRVRRHRRRRDPRGPRRGTRRRGRRRARPHPRGHRAPRRRGELPRHPAPRRAARAHRHPRARERRLRDRRRVRHGRARAAARRRRRGADRRAAPCVVQRLDGRRIDRVRFVPDARARGRPTIEGANDERLGGNRLAVRAARRATPSSSAPSSPSSRRAARRSSRSPSRAAAARRPRSGRWSTRRSCSR